MIKYVKKLWGTEEWLVNNQTYCAKFLNLKSGYQCSLHYHILKDETFYILDGIIEIEYGYGEREMKVGMLKAGEQIRICPLLLHRFKAVTNTAKILEVSTHHDDEDSYRIETSREV